MKTVTISTVLRRLADKGCTYREQGGQVIRCQRVGDCIREEPLFWWLQSVAQAAAWDSGNVLADDERLAKKYRTAQTQGEER